ncbi:MAG: PTS sugar transporter subunit IIA [Candidatus Atribacteria bacterium]|nr:MAG: PTS sugar transporter subunit IIA [Candidatus Atribacteria bacterium]
MNLTQILKPDCVKVPLKSKEKEAAIVELIELLDKTDHLQNKQDVIKAVLEREKTGSTGIGSGVAIPHGKCKAAKDFVMAIGIADEPIDFKSIDKKPVKIVILLISPLDQTELHIQALASVSSLMFDAKFKQRMENAESAQEFYQLICSRDNT